MYRKHGFTQHQFCSLTNLIDVLRASNCKYRKIGAGFTLIELLVVISIIGILIGLSIVGLQAARAGARDARRKSDLEQIRSSIEIYKADCGVYPASLPAAGTPLTGILASCSPPGSTYISAMPGDPTPASRNYAYNRLTTSTYTLCASLEQGSAGTVTNCGSCGSFSCTYRVTNP